jgi:hypothetical protein
VADGRDGGDGGRDAAVLQAPKVVVSSPTAATTTARRHNRTCE